MRLIPLLFVTGLTLVLGACAAGDNSKASSGNPGGPSDPNANAGTGGGTSGNDGTGAQPNLDVPGPGGVDPNDARDVAVRELQCDENGENCTCLRLAMLGSLDSAANDKDTQPFVDWLNGNSDGTARVTMVPQKPTLDEAFLGQYDVLLVANVNSWTFSEAEKAAVAAWSANGGGIISLTGFTSVSTEPAATSQLIEFAGLSYTSTETAIQGTSQSTPVYYQDGTVDLRNCLGWTESSDAIITAAVPFLPQEGELTKLTHQLDYVGAFKGWGVSAPAEAITIAVDPTSDQPIAVAHEVNRAGRVLAYGDEWIVFANLWEPRGAPQSGTQQDQYNICWLGGSEFHSVATLYQIKQFWFNAINWVAPPNECSFTIVDEDVDIEVY